MKRSTLILTIGLVIVYFPLIYMGVFSFNESPSMTEFNRFSMQNYVNLSHNLTLLLVLVNSIIVAIFASTIAVIIGTCGAIAIYQQTNKKKNMRIRQLNNVMILAPDVVIGVSYLALFSLIGIKLGVITVIITHAVFCVPIVIITVLPRLYQIEDGQIKAALDLGARVKDLIRLILLPNIEDALIVSFFISLFYSFDDFGVTFFITGNGFVTLPIEIYSQARRGISMELYALSTIMFIVITLAVVLNYSFHYRKGIDEKNR